MTAPAPTFDCGSCRGAGQQEFEEDPISDTPGSYLLRCEDCNGTGTARCFQCLTAIATVPTVGGAICAECDAAGYGVPLPVAAGVREGCA